MSFEIVFNDVRYITGKAYSHEFAWKRDEKQAYEYRTKKTYDIHANFTQIQAIFIRYEKLIAWNYAFKFSLFKVCIVTSETLIEKDQNVYDF